ncbi:MAG: F0F1 ATP synthase subunit B [Rhizobiales bacterium]|nr:F0F1 ATP synthase subunit B [Hyphomicrobiales bacterium]
MFDATFWALVGLVLFLALIIYLKVPGKMGEALDKRSDAIRSELEDARRLREEAQALLAEYQRKQREAEREAEDIINQAKREAKAMTSDAKAKLEAYVERRQKQAEEKIQQAEAQAVQDVRSRSVDVAIATAQALIADKVGGKIADGLIAQSIKDVGSKLN